MEYNYNPLVSIITPAYNCSSTIIETIKSVQNQSYSNWEMIIIDDMSTDNTVEVIRLFTKNDKRIKLICKTRNTGVSDTRNIGLKDANGKYIAFLDSDDLWKKDKLSKQVNFMLSHNYAFTYTAFERFHNNTREVVKIINIPKIMHYKDIYKNTIIGCLTVMVDVEQIGKFQMPNINHCEDQCTWISILKRGYIAYGLEDVLAEYRLGNNSLTSNKIKVIKDQWFVYRKYHNFSIIRSIYYMLNYAFNIIKR